MFLKDTCKATIFDQDFILLEDLLLRYEDWGIKKGLNPRKMDQLIGGPEILEFGAVPTESVSVPFIKGITSAVRGKKDIFTRKSTAFSSGFVRVPRSQLGRDEGRISRFARKLSNSLTRIDGMIPNFMILLLHFAIICIGIGPLVFIFAFVTGEITKVQSEVGARTFEWSALIFPDSKHFWISENVSSATAIAIFIFVGAYYISAGIELISYYSTCFENFGRYEVKETRLKRIQRIIYWTFLFILFVAYVPYVIIVLSWCILGAILNPSKFLPYASAALAFVYYVYAKYRQIH